MKQTQLFFNTIHLSGKDLAAASLQCSKQEARVISIMSTLDKAMTPFEVQNEYERAYPSVPITSIRRSMTNLAQRGVLEKSGAMKLEIYGKPNHTWKLVRESLTKQTA